MNHYYSDDRSLPNYYIYPKALLDLALNDTETRAYLLLLNRARLSARSGDDWRDAQGRIYLFYPVSALAGDLACSETIVYKALNTLEEKDLIRRQRMGYGKPNRIYVKLPEEVNKTADHDLNFSADHDLNFSGGQTSTFPDPTKKERIRKRDQEGQRAHISSFGARTNASAGPTQAEYERMQRYLRRLESEKA